MHHHPSIPKVDAVHCAAVHGQPANFKITLTNTSDGDVPLVFASSQQADVILSQDGKAVYEWSADRAFTQEIRCQTLPAGQTYTVQLAETKPLPVSPGDYTLTARTVTAPYPPDFTMQVTVLVCRRPPLPSGGSCSLFDNRCCEHPAAHCAAPVRQRAGELDARRRHATVAREGRWSAPGIFMLRVAPLGGGGLRRVGRVELVASATARCGARVVAAESAPKRCEAEGDRHPAVRGRRRTARRRRRTSSPTG
jgi:hypothetical protein